MQAVLCSEGSLRHAPLVIAAHAARGRVPYALVHVRLHGRWQYQLHGAAARRHAAVGHGP
jgi:hypothetical protein